MKRIVVAWALSLSLVSTSAAQDAKKTWDVNTLPGPSSTVSFTTDEGTWLNVDVSPDGQSIVFDMLGDLYLLPMEGGKATSLTSGPAFDMQPRFSPDGSRIAFTSDRGGGDNLWTIALDGTNARQITDESFRLVNGPAWTPDGQYLLGRKHFTSTRSLGAGEVWMYHVGGGGTGDAKSAGLQLTKRKNDQQDQGNEIALSPDGRYVYFSEDVSGGSTFQYNKDPNGQIYAIRRLDRQTGQLKNLITGSGGSARPQPSPDGEHIAFVRRVRDRSVLFVHDLETGVERPLFDNLSRDQQETWAIFGVYPGFNWTPDSKHLVFWAQGKLWKLDVAAAREAWGTQDPAFVSDLVQPQAIPFEVDVEREVASTVRYPQVVHPDRFTAKMIRDVATSPDGNLIVFHAAGYLWKKSMPNGSPERLTRSVHFEYEPAFSPDGTQLVYTTWSDADYGAIYRVAIAGGTPEKLTARPGYFFSPRYSADGSRIVYRRGSGNAMLGTRHSVDTGLYWMDISGSATAQARTPHLIREGGSDPRFNATGDRVFFQTGGGLSKEYKSVRLDGGDERTHFDLKYANTVVPSPDRKWVAFTDLFNAYIAPFPETGGSVELSKEMKAVPVRQVTRDAGTSLHWSADGESLHWVIGPEYFTRDLTDSVSFAASDAKPDSVGISIGLTLDSDAPSGRVALVGARIITMNGAEVIESGTLILNGNRIESVGPAGSVSIPEGTTQIDASGKTIIPGIVDAHGHAAHFFSGPTPKQNWAYYANLAYGVTTAHDPSANTETVFTLSEMVRSGEIVGPRIYSTGTILYGADGDFKAVVNSLDDARSHLRRMKAVGAFSVKSYNQPRRDQRQQVIKAARELEMLVVPEGGSTFYHNLTMIVDGHTGIEHNVPVAPLYRDVLELWKATEVGYTPTLVVSYGSLNGEYYWYQHSDVWNNRRLLQYVPRSVVDARSRRRLMAPDEEYYHVVIAEDTKKLVDQGNIVQVGAHGQLQGLAAHWEMWMFVQGGMTPHEALRSATLHGARYLGLDRDLGSIEPGKLADLVVLDANPLRDIRNSDSVRYVIANGRVYDAETMNEIGNHPRKRDPFYWER